MCIPLFGDVVASLMPITAPALSRSAGGKSGEAALPAPRRAARKPDRSPLAAMIKF